MEQIGLFKKLTINLSDNLFWIGIFLLPSAPFFSILLFIYPILLGIRINTKNIFTDKANFLLFTVASLMIIKSLISTLFLKEEINNWDQNLNWIGLGNYIPLFLFYLGFQPYLNSDLKRQKLGNPTTIAGYFSVSF